MQDTVPLTLGELVVLAVTVVLEEPLSLAVLVSLPDKEGVCVSDWLAVADRDGVMVPLAEELREPLWLRVLDWDRVDVRLAVCVTDGVFVSV